MGKALIPPEPAEVHEVMLRDALEERYLAYALSTIMHRALPDARDGLTPVHRRILYGMRLMRLGPGTPCNTSAKIAGAAEMGGGSGFPDRPHYRRFQGKHRGSLRHRARLVPHPRQMEPGRRRTRHLGRGHHRNSLAGAEVPAGRENRRTAERQEAALGRRRQG